MKIELLILLITGFLIANTYYDNKLLEKVKTWKKYYKMAFYGFVGLCLFLVIKKTPNKSYELLNHANQFIKFMPLDRNTKNLFEPFIDFVFLPDQILNHLFKIIYKVLILQMIIM